MDKPKIDDVINEDEFIEEFGKVLAKDTGFIKQIDFSHKYLMSVDCNITIGIHTSDVFNFGIGIHIACRKCFPKLGVSVISFNVPNSAKAILEFQRLHNHER